MAYTPHPHAVDVSYSNALTPSIGASVQAAIDTLKETLPSSEILPEQVRIDQAIGVSTDLVRVYGVGIVTAVQYVVRYVLQGQTTKNAASGVFYCCFESDGTNSNTVGTNINTNVVNSGGLTLVFTTSASFSAGSAHATITVANPNAEEIKIALWIEAVNIDF